MNIPIREYHSYLSPEAGLYRGCEYLPYAHLLKDGHPYFDQGQMQPGSVLYRGVLYTDVPLLFDLVKETLVINNAYKVFKIALIGEEIDSFTIQDHIFIHYRDSVHTIFRPGFYQLLHQGRITVLKKEKKTVREEIDGVTINKLIDYSVAYYLKKDNIWFAVNSEKGLLRAFGSRRSACKKFLRRNHLKFRKDKENTLLQSAGWYESQPQ